MQGENGRDLIWKKLLKTDLNIHLIECYKRVLKNFNIYKEVEKWRIYGVNTLIITNGETLIELKKLVTNTDQMLWLLECQIFVISTRLLILAKKLGWKKVFVSHHANNYFLIKFIRKQYSEF